MKFVVLYVANEEDALRYRKILEDRGIQVPIHVVSKEDILVFEAYELPALVTEHITYVGEFVVTQTLLAYKKSGR